MIRTPYIQEWHEVDAEHLPSSSPGETPGAFSGPGLLYLASSMTMSRARCSVKGVDDFFCEGIPVGGNRADEHFGSIGGS